jgi:hypothetical protein
MQRTDLPLGVKEIPKISTFPSDSLGGLAPPPDTATALSSADATRLAPPRMSNTVFSDGRDEASAHDAATDSCVVDIL